MRMPIEICPNMVPHASSASVNSFFFIYWRWHAGGQPRQCCLRHSLNLCSQNEIALRQSVNRMGEYFHLSATPRQQNIGMVPLFLSNPGRAVHKCQCTDEIGISKCPRQMMPVNNCPFRKLSQQHFTLCRSQCRNATCAGNTNFLSQIHAPIMA